MNPIVEFASRWYDLPPALNGEYGLELPFGVLDKQLGSLDCIHRAYD